jgi:hypothetical protein
MFKLIFNEVLTSVIKDNYAFDNVFTRDDIEILETMATLNGWHVKVKLGGKESTVTVYTSQVLEYCINEGYIFSTKEDVNTY